MLSLKITRNKARIWVKRSVCGFGFRFRRVHRRFSIWQPFAAWRELRSASCRRYICACRSPDRRRTNARRRSDLHEKCLHTHRADGGDQGFCLQVWSDGHHDSFNDHGTASGRDSGLLAEKQTAPERSHGHPSTYEAFLSIRRCFV